MDTARYIFGRATARPDLFLRHTELGWTPDEENEQLKEMLTSSPGAGVNTVLVGQIFNVRASLGLAPTEGEAIIFRPDGKGSYAIVGQLTAVQWGDLVRDLVVLQMDPKRLDDSPASGSPAPHSQSPYHQ